MNKKIIKAAQEMGLSLSPMSRHWDGKKSIVEMKRGGSRQWRQMEWMGFYFEFLCKNLLLDIVTMPGPRYGNSSFDALHGIPWDFKMHATNTSSHRIVVNDREAVEKGLKKFGAVGMILGMGDVEYNDNGRTFQKWHEKLKGGSSKYTRDRIKRGAWSRFRKVAVDLKQISFIVIDNKFLKRSGSFQAGFRNADGTPRREKVLIDLEKVGNNLIHAINF